MYIQLWTAHEVCDGGVLAPKVQAAVLGSTASNNVLDRGVTDMTYGKQNRVLLLADGSEVMRESKNWPIVK